MGLALTRRAAPASIATEAAPAWRFIPCDWLGDITPQGGAVTDLIVEIIQRRRGYFDANRQKTVDKSASETPEADFTFYGGCTLLIDPSDHKVRYAITKHILSDSRLKLEREFRGGTTASTSLRATYFGDPDRESPPRERFALLHGGF